MKDLKKLLEKRVKLTKEMLALKEQAEIVREAEPPKRPLKPQTVS